ncbi:hypothetical protein EVAR_34539_1 [Eumeta japonica]|uniref:Uncharacterized protein n=1 Tax=Eumeta variegata TaxID=151549 RepID=A0A4C1X8I0_EUMVA|nr:hypothetical protein EVAR_34539_1 [Eumeta japonica]
MRNSLFLHVIRFDNNANARVGSGGRGAGRPYTNITTPCRRLRSFIHGAIKPNLILGENGNHHSPKIVLADDTAIAPRPADGGAGVGGRATPMRRVIACILLLVPTRHNSRVAASFKHTAAADVNEPAPAGFNRLQPAVEILHRFLRWSCLRIEFAGNGIRIEFDAREVEICTGEGYPATRPIDRIIWDYYPLKPFPWGDSIVKAITYDNHSIAALQDVKSETSTQCTRVQYAKFGDFASRGQAILRFLTEFTDSVWDN